MKFDCCHKIHMTKLLLKVFKALKFSKKVFVKNLWLSVDFRSLLLRSWIRSGSRTLNLFFDTLGKNQKFTKIKLKMSLWAFINCVVFRFIPDPHPFTSCLRIYLRLVQQKAYIFDVIKFWVFNHRFGKVSKNKCAFWNALFSFKDDWTNLNFRRKTLLVEGHSVLSLQVMWCWNDPNHKHQVQKWDSRNTKEFYLEEAYSKGFMPM